MSDKTPHKISWNGRQWTIAQLAKEYNLDYTTLSVRLKQNNLIVTQEILLQPEEYKKVTIKKREEKLEKNSK